MNEFLLDLTILIMRGDLLEAWNKYYHREALQNRPVIQPIIISSYFWQDMGLRNFKKYFLTDAREVLRVERRGPTAFILWKYAIKSSRGFRATFTVMSVQIWSKGKIIREEFIHYN